MGIGELNSGPHYSEDHVFLNHESSRRIRGTSVVVVVDSSSDDGRWWWEDYGL